jgi:predicted Fe-Mo cluster-binding NifX family protein
MRIAIATDQDFVSSCFGCTPDCTVVEIEGGTIHRTFVVPNPGWSHRTWADFLERNAVACLIVGNIGANARAVLGWRGIDILSGAEGSIDSIVAKYVEGMITASDGPCAEPGCGFSPTECRAHKAT